jgi:hypothetical protein
MKGSSSSSRRSGASLIRKDHPQRDDEEHHAARHAERRLLQPQVMQDRIARRQEGQQHQVGDHHLAPDDPNALRTRISSEQRMEHRDISQGVHDDGEQDGGGEQIHAFGAVDSAACQIQPL